MRALWIEDHHLIGDSLEVLLQVLMPDISLDKARDAESAVALATSIPYELVLLDWWLGDEDGSAVISALRRANNATPIVVVSGDDRDAIMRRAMELGASGYVPKAADPSELINTIRIAVGGGVARPRANPDAAGGHLPPIDVEAVFPELTSRQADVFRGLMRGLSDKQIARELGVAETTVKTHVANILAVVGVHKRGEAVYQARMKGAGEGRG